jgi:hypothetical protein
VSPIFVRPVREQFEHDRLIRFLQAKYKRKAPVVALNVGDEQTAPVKFGAGTFFPDLVLWDGKRLVGVVEVETGESVNNLEAMAQWVHFAKARTPFHLYVPVPSVEVARRLCQSLGARVTELWTYRPTHDGFDLVRMVHDPTAPGAQMVSAPPAAAAPAKPEKAAPEKPVKAEKAAKPEKAPKPEKVVKPAKAVGKPAVRTPTTRKRPPAKAPAAKPKARKAPARSAAKAPAKARKVTRKR